MTAQLTADQAAGTADGQTMAQTRTSSPGAELASAEAWRAAPSPLGAVYGQIGGPARVTAAGQLIEASSFYRQSLQTLLLFNAVAVFGAPVLIVLAMQAGDGASGLSAAAVSYAQDAAAYFFAALGLTLAASFLAHLTLEKRAHAFFVEELVDDRRARAALSGRAPDAFAEETEALHRQANAHASLSGTSYTTSVFCVFLAVVAMAGGVFGTIDALSEVALIG